MRTRHVRMQHFVEIGHGLDAIGREGHDTGVVDQHVQASALQCALDVLNSIVDVGLVGGVELDEDQSTAGAFNEVVQGWSLAACGCEDGADVGWRKGCQLRCEFETEAAGAACNEVICHLADVGVWIFEEITNCLWKFGPDEDFLAGKCRRRGSMQ